MSRKERWVSIALNMLYPYPEAGVRPVPLPVQGAPANVRDKTLSTAGT